jgi:hypothetical protein
MTEPTFPFLDWKDDPDHGTPLRASRLEERELALATWVRQMVAAIPKGDRHVNNQWPSLVYTQASGHLLMLGSTAGLKVQGLGLRYNNSAYSDVLVNMEWADSPHESDPTDSCIVDCAFGRAGGTGLASALLRLQHTIISSVERCHFGNCVDSVVLGQSHTGYLSNVVIEKCTFNWASSRYIGVESGDAENIVVSKCAFENNPPDGVVGYNPGNGFTYNFVFRENWVGDVEGTATILQNLADLYTGMVIGNRIGAAAGSIASWSSYEGVAGVWLFLGNSFESGGDIFDNTVMPDGVIAIGNNFNNSGGTWGGGNGADVAPAKWVTMANEKPQGTGTSHRGKAVAGAKGGNVALDNLLAALDGAGIIYDQTS